MKPKPIGVVAGAGPLAGVSLLERIFKLATANYGCYRDADFPEVILISFPFSEMLTPEGDVVCLRKELYGCLERLRDDGAAILSIACNTLHVFLEDGAEVVGLVNLPQSISEAIPENAIPLVLCTSTSLRFGLHKRYFPCAYPDADVQAQVDGVIDQILRGGRREVIVRQLSEILLAQEADTVILGCTELSLYTEDLLGMGKTIVDPLDVLAKKILEKSFCDKEGC